MKVLITGADGFCAAHLIARLRRDPNVDITGLDLRPPQFAGGGVNRFYRVDITDRTAVGDVVADLCPDYLYHLAATDTACPDSVTHFSVNVLGTLNVIEAVRERAPCCRVLVVGSAAEYGPVPPESLPITESTPCHPIGPYGISKYAATLAVLDLVRRHGLRIVVARPFNIIGAGMPATLVSGAIVERARQAFARGKDAIIQVGDYDSERDFIAVADVVDAYVRLLDAEAWGEVVNLCSGKAYSIRLIAEALLSHAPRQIRIDFDPNLRPPSQVRRSYGSYEKAHRLIGFKPAIAIDQALKAVWEGATGAAIGCA